MPTEKSQETAQGLKRFKDELGDDAMGGPAAAKRPRAADEEDLSKILAQGQAPGAGKSGSSSSSGTAAANK